MTMNDLTAPLGQGRAAVGVPVTKIVAIALGLFLGAFVLWAILAPDRLGGQPVAVAPADLRIAKKPPEVVAVPRAAAPIEAAEPAAPATPPPGLAPGLAPDLASGPAVKSPPKVTVTIIDGKTGAKREVVVATPAEPASIDTTGQLPSKLRTKR